MATDPIALLYGDAQANVYGGSGEKARGSFCTPKWLADRIGPVDIDPCSNERSHIQARIRLCGTPGEPLDCGLTQARTVPAGWRSFENPPYERTEAGGVGAWINAYAHTDFIFLLRWDTSTKWFTSLVNLDPWIWFPTERRIEFEPPPGVKASSNPFPHALFCKSRPNDALCEVGRLFRMTK